MHVPAAVIFSGSKEECSYRLRNKLLIGGTSFNMPHFCNDYNDISSLNVAQEELPFPVLNTEPHDTSMVVVGYTTGVSSFENKGGFIFAIPLGIKPIICRFKIYSICWLK
jgi:hypothetical protein